jgi:hypothetical protein
MEAQTKLQLKHRDHRPPTLSHLIIEMKFEFLHHS